MIYIKRYELIERLKTGIFLYLLFGIPLIFNYKILFNIIMLSVLLIILFNEIPNISINIFSYIFLSIYIFVSIFCILYLNYMSSYIILILFALVSSYDVASYIIGNIIGNRKIAYFISPGKTWEGFIGGFIFSFFISLIFFKFNIFTILFVFLVSIFALIGDLIESFFKRLKGIKDSGNILPGHGGFFDRFDGIFFVSFLFYLLKSKLFQLLSIV
jgi:phosphatidate cytidylyltransferase